MRVFKRGIIKFGICLGLLASMVLPANAATPTYGHGYVNGVGNLTVYLDYSSGVGYWQTYINNAVNNWMYTGWSNPIYMTFVSSNYGSNLDFHQVTNSAFAIDAIGPAFVTYWQTGGQEVWAGNANWNWAEININGDYFSQASFTNFMAQQVVSRYVGHALGLNWYLPADKKTIMYLDWEAAIYNTVQYCDNEAILNLY